MLISPQKDIETKFGTRITSGVQYTDQNKQFCHDDTRTDILRDLKLWIQHPNPSDLKSCYWITGSGKSTLAATFANALKEVRRQRPGLAFSLAVFHLPTRRISANGTVATTLNA